MNRRIATYQNDLANVNLFISISALLLGSSFIFFVFNVLRALLWKNAPKAEANPWRARTLEWQVSSPPPVENFPSTPIVVGSPYGYGTGGRPHAVFGLAGASDEEVSA
jgi:cytochrome c oxidase subunit 1